MWLMAMSERDVWNLMIDYFPNFYTGEEGGDEEDGYQQEPDDSDVSEC